MLPNVLSLSAHGENLDLLLIQLLTLIKDGHLPGMIHEMTEWQSTIDRVYSLAAEKRVKRNEGRQNTDA